MLIVTRKVGERLNLGTPATIRVLEVLDDAVRLGIDALDTGRPREPEEGDDGANRDPRPS